MPTKSGKRELINTGTDKRFVKRDKEGKFKESVDVGRSLWRTGAANLNVAKSGYGDRGDIQPQSYCPHPSNNALWQSRFYLSCGA